MIRRPARATLYFFFNDTATTEIYTLSLHDALPICSASGHIFTAMVSCSFNNRRYSDRKSTRLNSSHGYISYAVFCLKKKKRPSHSTACATVHLHLRPDEQPCCQR